MVLKIVYGDCIVRRCPPDRLQRPAGKADDRKNQQDGGHTVEQFRPAGSQASGARHPHKGGDGEDDGNRKEGALIDTAAQCVFNVAVRKKDHGEDGCGG